MIFPFAASHCALHLRCSRPSPRSRQHKANALQLEFHRALQTHKKKVATPTRLVLQPGGGFCFMSRSSKIKQNIKVRPRRAEGFICMQWGPSAPATGKSKPRRLFVVHCNAIHNHNNNNLRIKFSQRLARCASTRKPLLRASTMLLAFAFPLRPFPSGTLLVCLWNIY